MWYLLILTMAQLQKRGNITQAIQAEMAFYGSPLKYSRTQNCRADIKFHLRAEVQKALWYVVLPGYISGTHEITIGSAPPKQLTVIE